jgi:hypothetical protein
MAYRLEPGVVYLAFENVAGFFAYKATGRKDFDRRSSVRSDEGDARILNLSFRREGPFSFVENSLGSV